jgi:hypothetical protein
MRRNTRVMDFRIGPHFAVMVCNSDSKLEFFQDIHTTFSQLNGNAHKERNKAGHLF